MKVQKAKYLIMGVLIGAVVTISAQGFAMPQGISITALLANHITIRFDGNAKALPEGYSILNYQGRTYVPTRFVAEALGAQVEWKDRKSTRLNSSH